MKKYKLIKEYPLSPELGYIEEYNTKYCEGYPEFWQEVKEPLFTTLDGKDVYEGDSYYTVFFKETKDKSDPERWKVLGKFSAEKLTGDDKWTNECKYFSSIASAINWLEENKPQFSKKQVINILRGFDKEINEFMYEEGEMQYSEYIEKYKDEE